MVIKELGIPQDKWLIVLILTVMGNLHILRFFLPATLLNNPG